MASESDGLDHRVSILHRQQRTGIPQHSARNRRLIDGPFGKKSYTERNPGEAGGGGGGVLMPCMAGVE